MKNQKAIVTFAIGEKYYTNWENFCKPNYPFLRKPPESKNLRARITRKIQSVVNCNASAKLRADAINTVFQSSFFIHFAGKMEEMHLVRYRATSWWDILS